MLKKDRLNRNSISMAQWEAMLTAKHSSMKGITIAKQGDLSKAVTVERDTINLWYHVDDSTHMISIKR